MKTKLLAVLAIAAVSALLAQGPLTPPGAPAPTMKTLQQIEPRTEINATNTPGDADSIFKITQSGSYYLSGNLTGVAAKYGIEIAANDVTLDLNGFALNGVAGSLGGVGVTAIVGGLAVMNGTARGWGQSGVGAGNAPAGTFENLRLTGNGFSGLIAGANATVTRCTARSNTGHGIVVLGGSVVTACTASLNTDAGINAAGVGCSVSDCVAESNTGDGIFANAGSTITHCVARGNGTGLENQGGGLITGCTAQSNLGDGILVASQCTVRENHCVANGSGAGSGAGIHATGTENRIEANHCLGADKGLDLDAGNNIVAANTVRGNTDNYSFAAGNQLDLLLCGIPESIDWPANVKFAGSFQFTATGGSAIAITASNVTLDLSGCTLSATTPVTGNAIVVSSGLRNIEVKNGTIAGTTSVTVSGSPPVWSVVPGGFSNGIVGSNPSYPDNCQFRQLRISGCRQDGLSGFENPMIDQVTTLQNGGTGIIATAVGNRGGVVTNSTATLNGADGISEASSVSNCTARFNRSGGIYHADTVINCAAKENGGSGIDGTAVSHCFAGLNGSDGINADGVVAFCHARNNNQNNNGSVDIDAPSATRTGNKPAP